jgi:hypothetical protein
MSSIWSFVAVCEIVGQLLTHWHEALSAWKIVVSMTVITAFLAYWTVTYAVTKRWCKGCDQGTQSAADV